MNGAILLFWKLIILNIIIQNKHLLKWIASTERLTLKFDIWRKKFHQILVLYFELDFFSNEQLITIDSSLNSIITYLPVNKINFHYNS